MARFAFILPREDMVKIAQHAADNMGMEVVLNKHVSNDMVLNAARECEEVKADIIVARGSQASILKEATSIPVVEIQLTGQEMAVLLNKACSLVPWIEKPKIGVVTFPNMIGDIHLFADVFNIELHTYFVSNNEDLELGAMQAVSEGMDVVVGGDMVNIYCRRIGKQTLFLESTEESICSALHYAKDTGLAIDAEQKNTAHLQTILNYSFYGILELTPDGVIVQANDMACKILRKKKENLEGNNLESLIATEDIELWEKLTVKKMELYFSLLNVAGVNVVVNAAAVMVGESAERIIFSFYEMSKIERSSAKALKERYRIHNYLARGRFEKITKTSKEMKQIVKLAREFANTLQPVLLQGELGSGKKLLAESIHNASPCSGGPFVVFDCGANLANQEKMLRRAIISAESGTLSIENFDCLDAASQHTLSYLLSNRMVKNEDKDAFQTAHVRLIASLNGNLRDGVKSGTIRQELYYLLIPMSITLPPLRERKEDLNQAIDLFMDEASTKLEKYVVLSEGARKVLLDYPWPGNYTQLKSFVERMVLTAPSRTVRDSYVVPLLKELYVQIEPMEKRQPAEMDEAAKKIVDALAKFNGNRTAAAMELGISKTTLWRRMKKLGIYEVNNYK